MAARLSREDLWSLEEYAANRQSFREKVITHKNQLHVSLGKHAALQFEDQDTIKYQIQEMLRIERIFEPDGIQEELDAYNDLIPDGTNWKASFFIEYPDAEERREALQRLRSIEHRVWVKVGDTTPTYAIANEDLPRSNEEKTAAVHFLRFQIPHVQAMLLHDDQPVSFGVDHPELNYTVEVESATRDLLRSQLNLAN